MYLTIRRRGRICLKSSDRWKFCNWFAIFSEVLCFLCPLVSGEVLCRNSSLSAHSNAAEGPITPLSPLPQPHFRQMSWGSSPGCWAPRCRSGPGVPLYPSPLWWGMCDPQEVVKISPPARSPQSLQFPLKAGRYATVISGTELFKCATSLMRMSYCRGWTLIMNNEQLLLRRGGVVIREPVSQAWIQSHLTAEVPGGAFFRWFCTTMVPW